MDATPPPPYPPAPPPGLPPAFDAATYRARNPALAHLSDAAALADYAATGRAAGRVASPAAEREGLLALIAGRGAVLEIGPFCRPLLTGPGVEYLDMLDAAGLRARAAELGLDATRCPDVIHHVGGLDRVDRRFDAVVSSHAIEHQPDLVHHLAEIERVLAADGACFLMIPDKRYCFDHFLAESGIAQVLQAHHERRRVHSLASVVEHGALVTHNDSGRHWAGDHGAPAADPGRVKAAMARFAQAGGAYVDVHAWQFTPDSFREIVATLGALGLTGLEAGAVYDTVHGRNEFCAVLTLSPQARARKVTTAAGIAVIAVQTADPIRYQPMLAVTGANVAAWCRRHGHGYEAFVGVKRGPHGWQATYNRIPLLAELVERGHRGWVLYLDADAYIHDLDFDLAGYLADKHDRAAILATSGVTEASWDVNAGVALINLGHPQGRRLVAGWAAKFAGLSDGRLAAEAQWLHHDNDQDLLHQLLREDRDVAAAVLVEGMDFMNSRHARFVRQHLRAQTGTLAERIAAIAAAVDEVAQRHGMADARPPFMEPAGGGRWASRLFHPVGHVPALVEAPVPPPRPALAEAAIAAWRRAGGGEAPPPPPPAADFVAALARGDVETVGAMLAGLGRASMAQGFLGGARQHERARDPLFRRRLALWTHDRLVSLAEAVGALPLELGEAGRWDVNARLPPAELFAMIEATLGVDLAPPAQVGGHLGLAVRDGIVLHMRMLDAIHAAWTLGRLAAAHGLGPARVRDIAPGAGLAAGYARRLGQTHIPVDRPWMKAVQAYVLGGGSGGGPGGDAGGDAAGGAADILFDADGLPAREPAGAAALLADARRLGARLFLSINQEAGLPGQTAVAELVAAAGGWRRLSRHRHWLRAGYVEEVYVAG